MSFRDSTKVSIKSRGKICFSQKNGKTGTMEEVYYVPNLKNNILSIWQLLEKGCLIFIKDWSDVVLKGQKWSSACICGDDKELDVQTQSKDKRPFLVGLKAKLRM